MRNLCTSSRRLWRSFPSTAFQRRSTTCSNLSNGINGRTMIVVSTSSSHIGGLNTVASYTTTTPSLKQQQNEEQQQKEHYLPKRIILIRHGESLGNVNELTYTTTPDWKIGLTDLGKEQAKEAGIELEQLCSGESLYTYVSPYLRTMETWQVMKQYIEERNENNKVNLIGTRQEPRIAEQQFGNFQNPEKILLAKQQRIDFGRFFFRFPNGEAGLDVYNRASSFLATVSRDIKQLRDTDIPMNDCNILVVTHGLTLRLILMRYFQLSVEEFEESYNAENAKLYIMDRCKTKVNILNNNNNNNTETEKEEDVESKEFYRLEEGSRDSLNLKGDVSNELPVYSRDRYGL